jgi:cytochrome c553
MMRSLCCRDTGLMLLVGAILLAADGRAVAAVDLELGRHLATECMACHRTAGAGGTIPNIFGMDEASFAAILKAYRDKRRPNPVMQSIASRLTDEEIAALARYFATSKP